MVTSRFGIDRFLHRRLAGLGFRIADAGGPANTSYSGTSAQPKAKLPAVMIRSALTSLRLARFCGSIGVHQ